MKAPILLLCLTLVLGACGTRTAGEADGPSERDPAAVGTTTAARCGEEYSVAAVEDRSFSFDGTVAAVHKSDGVASPPYQTVTFKVHEWFRGGSDAEVEVMTWPPYPETSIDGPAVDVGMRMLVAGERSQAASGDEELIAWPCGFTRDWDRSTAEDWRSVAQEPRQDE